MHAPIKEIKSRFILKKISQDELSLSINIRDKANIKISIGIKKAVENAKKSGSDFFLNTSFLIETKARKSNIIAVSA